jgi:hypothetical protein
MATLPVRINKNSRFCDQRCAAYRQKQVNEYGYPLVWRKNPQQWIEHDNIIRFILPYMDGEVYSNLGQSSKYLCSTLFDRVLLKDYKKIVNRMEGQCDRRIISLRRNMYHETEKPFQKKSRGLYAYIQTMRSLRWERESEILEAYEKIGEYHRLIDLRVNTYIKQRQLMNDLRKKYSTLHITGVFLRHYLEGKRYLFPF